MGIPHFTQGYPPDGSSLGNTKTVIRGNLDGTFLTLGVDHINNNGSPGSNPAGYHNVVHWTAQGSDPSLVNNITQEYSKTDTNSIQQKWLKSTGGNAYQQTMMLDGVFSLFGKNPGWSYLPGGLILQWGTVSFPAGNAFVSNSIIYTGVGNIEFPTATFGIVTGLIVGTRSSSNANSNTLATDNLVATGFSYSFNSSSGSGSTQFPGFFWIAIGN